MNGTRGVRLCASVANHRSLRAGAMAYSSVHTFSWLTAPQHIRNSTFNFYSITGKSEAVGSPSFFSSKDEANYSTFPWLTLFLRWSKEVKWCLLQSTKEWCAPQQRTASLLLSVGECTEELRESPQNRTARAKALAVVQHSWQGPCSPADTGLRSCACICRPANALLLLSSLSCFPLGLV